MQFFRPKSGFKEKYTLNERSEESMKVSIKYPDRIPIICEKNANSRNTPDIDKIKYLVPCDLTMGQFIYVIRKRLAISSNYALYIFVNGYIPPSSALLNVLYENEKDEDGFLYMTYSFENTFGKNMVI